ncbi:cellulose binding domain-containing protein [Dactylosporangium sp. AC04546]|uniref:cellulose binding domain-containing protein n=1 Tax=Dactylosporangium sp. AC04546 TaxID=2862460 RepID=UPI001EE0DEC4|nr:cellulose binding domain-containing protein [Dactylosporangium sp. AC04546]WVK78642.1 cellulose binding domain-containing protein [Dactylosporangium sp. AC04546]
MSTSRSRKSRAPRSAARLTLAVATAGALVLAALVATGGPASAATVAAFPGAAGGNRVDYDGDSNLTNGKEATWEQYTDVPTHRSTRFNVPNITTEPASTALPKVLDNAGAFWWARDAVDTRIVGETRTTTGTLINAPNATEWNNLWNAAQVNSPGGWDTDRDGMPNAWERANGLNPNADDHNGDADGDGYRNIEEYLDHAAQGGQGGQPSPTNPTSSPAGGGACSASYRTVNSWSGGFQAEVTVQAGSSAIGGWTVRWMLAGGQTVSQVWNGRLVTSGTAATVTNESYNGALAAAASTTFGFLATGTASTPALTCSTA